MTTVDLTNSPAIEILSGINNELGIVAEFVVNNLSVNSWGYEPWLGGVVENAGMVPSNADLNNRFDVTDHSIHNPKNSNIWCVVGDDAGANFSYSTSIGYPFESGGSSEFGTISIISNDMPNIFKRQFEGAKGSISVGGLLKPGEVGEHLMAHSEYKKLFSATIDYAPRTGTGMDINLRSRRRDLEVPFNANTYKGTGGIEGGGDLRGQQKPYCIGFPKDVTPTNLSDGLYQFHDGQRGKVGEIAWFARPPFENLPYFCDGDFQGNVTYYADGSGVAEFDDDVIVLTPAAVSGGTIRTAEVNIAGGLVPLSGGASKITVEFTARVVGDKVSRMKVLFNQKWVDLTSDFKTFTFTDNYTFQGQQIALRVVAWRGYLNSIYPENDNTDFDIVIASARVSFAPASGESIKVFSETSGQLWVSQVDSAIAKKPPVGVAVYDLNGYLKTHPNEKNVSMHARGIFDTTKSIAISDSASDVRPVTNAYSMSVLQRILEDRLNISPVIDDNVTQPGAGLYGERVAAYIDGVSFSEFSDYWLSSMNYFMRWDGDQPVLKKRLARHKANAVGTITGIDLTTIIQVDRNSYYFNYSVLFNRSYSGARSGQQISEGSRVDVDNTALYRSSTRSVRDIPTPLVLEDDAYQIARTSGWYENLKGKFSFTAYDQQFQFNVGDIVFLDTDDLWDSPCEIIKIDYPKVTGNTTIFEVMF